MTSGNRTYLAIDMKSFYASVECVDRGLNPLTTNLVVADETRTDKTICLAVSPSLKAYGIPGRPRLFEVNEKVRQINAERRRNRDYRKLEFIIAPPRMAHYIEVSTKVYETYLKYISPEDIHVYSIDEVFIDCTEYLRLYKTTAHELTMRLIRDVLATTGITATAGIGTNLYLCKVAMDIVAKHKEADADGVRIAELDEMSYRSLLWDHKPLTDFWRVGHGIADRLATYGLDTMGKIARQSIQNEELFYRLFGINAELLIDHAWGWEPCTMPLIKAYKPENKSLGNGQVLSKPYTYDMGKTVVKEMADSLALDLVSKRMTTNQIVLTVSYDAKSSNSAHHAHGTRNLTDRTSLSSAIMEAALSIYESTVNPKLLIKRLYISANNILSESIKELEVKQLDLFTDYEQAAAQDAKTKAAKDKERRLQEAQLAIKQKFGKNAILKGVNLEEGATSIERNKQIGGHKA